MKTKKTASAVTAITSLPPAPVDERRGRMIRYSLAMLIRLVCIVVAFLVPFGWWTALPAVGAIVLPYVAVVLANVGAEGERGQVERPGGIEIYRPDAGVPGYERQDPAGRPFDTSYGASNSRPGGGSSTPGRP